MKDLYLLLFSPIFIANLSYAQQTNNDLNNNDTIIVTASKIRGSVDTRYYDIKTSPDAKTLTAEEAITRLPGAIRDINGKITILGKSNIVYQLDGEYFPQDLATQIPASKLSRIEVTTNPGAKSGGSDIIIINLITNKKEQKPKNILIRFSADSLKNTNLNANYDYEKNKNKYSIFSFLKTTKNEYYRQQYEKYITNDSFTQGLRESDISNSSAILTNFFMLEHKLDNNKKIVIGIIPAANSSEHKSQEAYNFYANTNNLDYNSKYYNNSISYIIALSDNNDKSKNNISIQYQIDNSNNKSYNIVNNKDFYRYNTKSNTDTITLNIESEEDFASGNKLEYGLKSTSKNLNNRYLFNDDYYGLYKYKSNEAAIYTTYQFPIGKFDIKPGIRFEYYDINKINNDKINDFSFILPSLHIGTNINKYNNIKLSFAIKSNDLNNIYFNDLPVYQRYNIYTIGNSGLKLGTSTNYEISYEYIKAKISIITTAYYRETRNDISNIYNFLDINYNGDSIYYSEYINIRKTINNGINLNFKHNFNKYFEYNIDLNYYNKDQIWVYNNIENKSKTNVFDWKINGNIKLGKNDSILFMLQQKGKNLNLNTQNDNAISSSIKYSHNFKNNISIDIEAIDFLANDKYIQFIRNDNYEENKIIKNDKKALRMTIAKRF